MPGDLNVYNVIIIRVNSGGDAVVHRVQDLEALAEVGQPYAACFR
jgi:hypothetical protein